MTRGYVSDVRQNDQIVEQDLQFEQSWSASSISHSLPSNPSDSEKSEKLGDAVRLHEHSQILEALINDGGNRRAVAEKLGISQRTLRYKIAKMRELGIEVPTRYGAVNH